MTWYLSPSGWPINADDGSLFALRLAASGWQPLNESQVQAAIDAYNAGAPLPPAAVEFLTLDGLEAAAAVAPTGDWDFTAATVTGIAGGGGSTDLTKLEATVMHNGTAGGGPRPTGYARVRWVNPAGTTYARPTNMAAGDVWEHAV